MAARNAALERKSFVQRFTDTIASSSTQQLFVGSILFLALLAFEVFNFDTTRYALNNLLGDEKFAGVTWAAILAVAFCAIDFAGLSRMFTPQIGSEEPSAVRYLTGAWFLGATMNACMTWWAVSLTLLTHDLGNEVLSREQLLNYVPVFVAALVWVTRILFIGSIAVAGDQLINGARNNSYQHGSSSSNKKFNSRTQTRKARESRPVPKTRTTRPSGAGFSSSSHNEPVSFSPSTGLQQRSHNTQISPSQPTSAMNAAGRSSTRPSSPTAPSRGTAAPSGMGNINRTSRIRRSSGNGVNRPPTVMRASGRNRNGN